MLPLGYVLSTLKKNRICLRFPEKCKNVFLQDGFKVTNKRKWEMKINIFLKKMF